MRARIWVTAGQRDFPCSPHFITSERATIRCSSWSLATKWRSHSRLCRLDDHTEFTGIRWKIRFGIPVTVSPPKLNFPRAISWANAASPNLRGASSAPRPSIPVACLGLRHKPIAEFRRYAAPRTKISCQLEELSRRSVFPLLSMSSRVLGVNME